MVSGLTFRSLIHFEFVFVCDVRKCSNFILLHVAVWCHSPVWFNFSETTGGSTLQTSGGSPVDVWESSHWLPQVRHEDPRMS